MRGLSSNSTSTRVSHQGIYQNRRRPVHDGPFLSSSKAKVLLDLVHDVTICDYTYPLLLLHLAQIEVRHDYDDYED